MTHHARQTQTERDCYFTPQFAADLQIDRLEEKSIIEPGDTIAEPCCGAGHLADWLEQRGYEVLAGDVDPKCEGAVTCDVLLPTAVRHYATADAVITNPPYTTPTATAAEVAKALLEWGMPVSLLVNDRFREPCAKKERTARSSIMSGPVEPADIHFLGRVEYESVHKRGEKTPIMSSWITWLPARCRF